MSTQLKKNQTSEAELVVGITDLASEMPLTEEDNSPPVFATTKMILLMEWAASRMMNDLLQPGELSVGVGVNIKHLAATPLGEKVIATATFIKQEDKLYYFEVEASDSAGIIGKGEHTRAIINAERLMSSAKKRLAKKL